MDHPESLIAATTYRPLVAFLERAVRPRGMILTQIQPSGESLVDAVVKHPRCLVVVHASPGDSDWIDLLKAVKTATPNVKVLVVSERAETVSVARAVVNGADNFAVFSGTADLLVMQGVIADALAGKEAPADSVFGGLREMLSCEKAGRPRYGTASDRKVSAARAMKQCADLGLTPAEIATWLGVSEDAAVATAARAERTPRATKPTMAGRLHMVEFALIAGLALAWLYGRPREKHLLPVSGAVTLDGQPVAHARICFCRQGGSHIASGKTDAKGEYRLTTLQPGDGAEEGLHVVWVVMPSRVREHVAMNDPMYAEKVIRLHEAMLEEHESGAAEGADAIPESYRAMESSPLRAEVRGREPMRLNFTLKR